MMARVALALVLACSSVARADAPRLRLLGEPLPRHLRMRPRAAVPRAPVTSAVTPAPAPGVPPVTATSSTRADVQTATTFAASDDAIGLVRDLRRPISARFSMGYVVDGTALTGEPTHGGATVRSADFRQLRAYAVGEGTFSSRGVVLPSLSTYLATSFQFASPQRSIDEMGNDVVVAPPVAIWFDRSGVQNRAAWLEIKDFLPNKRFAPLRVRAGQQYVYGPWMLHMYGAKFAWDGKLVSLSIYGGSRVPDYTLVEVTEKDRAGIGGVSARIDLRALKQKIPFAFGAELLAFTARGAATDRASQHALLQADWRPRQDVALIGRARFLDRKVAHEHVQLRSRYKQVTNLVFDFTYRHATDWRWDPSVTNPDPLQARRYLDFGPVVPQMILSGRAGTLIKENVDVLVRGAVANDVDRDIEANNNTYSPSYVELGGGFEVRLRRTVALALTGLSRQTKRYATVSEQIPDIPLSIEPLPPQYSGDIGERGFVELGTMVRMSLGARRFSAVMEAYGRRTRYALIYCTGRFEDGTPDTACQSALDTGVLDTDYRLGGRVMVEAWVGSQLRLFASYELSSRIDLAPEISGYKSLRLVMEGVY